MLRESACKVVLEWRSSLYTHIKSIRLGYEQSPNFTNKQILIRPAANNRSLTVSTRTNSSEKWTFTEHLNFPINPTDLHKLGQKTQPCKSSLPGVIFKFISKTEYYKNITENPTKTLPNGFKKVLNGPSSKAQP